AATPCRLCPVNTMTSPCCVTNWWTLTVAKLFRVGFPLSSAPRTKRSAAARAQAIAKIRAGLEQVAATVQRGQRCSGRAQIERRVAKLFGNKSAQRYFRWELIPLTAEEQAALPPPGRGCRRATHRLVVHFDAAAAEADAA